MVGTALAVLWGMLLVVALLSVVEKFTVLLSRAAKWHPVMLTNEWRRRYATTLISVTLVLDLSVLAALLLAPAYGAALFFALVVAYTAAGLAIYREQGARQSTCRCLFGALEAHTRASFLARNSVIVAASLVVASNGADASGPAIAAGLVATLALHVSLKGLERWTRLRPAVEQTTVEAQA